MGAQAPCCADILAVPSAAGSSKPFSGETVHWTVSSLPQTTINPEKPRRFTPAHTINMARAAHPIIKFHETYISPPVARCLGRKVAEFYSATTRLSGRFRGPFCLRDSQPGSLADQIRQRVSRKSVWIRQGGDGIFFHVAYVRPLSRTDRVHGLTLCENCGA